MLVIIKDQVTEEEDSYRIIDERDVTEFDCVIKKVDTDDLQVAMKVLSQIIIQELLYG